MLNERELDLDHQLRNMAESLDIPPSKYKQAVECYQAVGEWLEEGQYTGCFSLPEITPQGSFRLGTVVRPLREDKEADYDIDLVCKLPISIDSTTPEAVKEMIGSRLKEHDDYRRMLDAEGRRCWTLEYAEQDGIGFHMDILPAVPSDDASKRTLLAHGIPWEYAQHALDATDKDKRSIRYSWKDTNPTGYAEWFENINRPIFVKIAASQKRLLAENAHTIYCSVDDVPDALVRTPLQRAIQVLKRHRDLRFLNHKWEIFKPISTILTTLAAKAYQNENSVYTALKNIVDRLDTYAMLLDPSAVITGPVGNLIGMQDGRWYILNPVNPGENFADRWNDADSHYAEAFFLWVSWIKQDLRTILSSRDAYEAKSLFESLFKQRMIKTASTEKPPVPARTNHPPVVLVPKKTDQPSMSRIELPTRPSKPWRP